MVELSSDQIETLMEAVTREIASEYRRFYGA
jgi:hypothetical protein